MLSFGTGSMAQLGLGPDWQERKKPAPVRGMEDAGGVVKITVGALHNAVVGADGRLWSWGCNDEGALGREDDGNDHTLVVIDRPFLKWARMGRKPVQTQRVRIVGTPAGNEDVYREGYVSRVRDDEVWLVIPGFGGDSGSALFDDGGRIVGVLSGARTWVDHRSGAVFTVIVAMPVTFSEKQWKAAGV